MRCLRAGSPMLRSQAAARRTLHKTGPSPRRFFRTERNRAFDSYLRYDTSMRQVPRPTLASLALLALSSVATLHAAKTLEIFFIDVEGGQSTLLVAPSGQTLLIDTGYAGNS